MSKHGRYNEVCFISNLPLISLVPSLFCHLLMLQQHGCYGSAVLPVHNGDSGNRLVLQQKLFPAEILTHYIWIHYRHMKTSHTDGDIYCLATRSTAKNVERRCKMNEMRVVQWWSDRSTVLTVLTTRLLPPLFTCSILHITQVVGSPLYHIYHIYLDITLYHNACVLQLTSWWWTFMDRNV